MLYETTIRVLNELPGVMPKKTKALIHDMQDQCFVWKTQSFQKVQMGTKWLEYNEFAEMVHHESFLRSDFATPRGAQLLIELYKEGALCMRKGAAISEPSEAVKRYAAGEGGFSDSYKRQAVEEERRLRMQYLIDHPEEIKEEQFYMDGLLDTLFIKRYGLTMEPHSLVIDGIEVRKLVSRHDSNSRKSFDYQVVARWTGHDGQDHEYLIRASIYAGNRHSDPERNWGLGRE